MKDLLWDFEDIIVEGKPKVKLWVAFCEMGKMHKITKICAPDRALFWLKTYRDLSPNEFKIAQLFSDF